MFGERIQRVAYRTFPLEESLQLVFKQDGSFLNFVMDSHQHNFLISWSAVGSILFTEKEADYSFI